VGYKQMKPIHKTEKKVKSSEVIKIKTNRFQLNFTDAFNNIAEKNLKKYIF
jgi:hypothetical protein